MILTEHLKIKLDALMALESSWFHNFGKFLLGKAHYSTRPEVDYRKPAGCPVKWQKIGTRARSAHVSEVNDFRYLVRTQTETPVPGRPCVAKRCFQFVLVPFEVA